MLWAAIAFLVLFLYGYSDNQQNSTNQDKSNSHDQNDPYTIEETEFEYEAPEPYYEEEYPHLHHQDSQENKDQKDNKKWDEAPEYTGEDY